MKITKLTNTGYDLAVEMSSDDGIRYDRLLHFLKSPAGVYDYLNAVAQLIDNLSDAYQAAGERFIDNWPWLRQEGEEGDIWMGEPVVCDGWFELKGSELWFSGNKYTHGGGGPVSRKVHPNDIIEWHRCEPLQAYREGIHHVIR